VSENTYMEFKPSRWYRISRWLFPHVAYIGPRRCPECLQEIDEQPHLPECPWRWIEDAE
jgi:hypothetical protein